MPIRLLLAALCASMACVTAGATAGAMQTVMWGGEHVQMDVTKTGAHLEFDCASGTITEVLPETGTFSVKGTYAASHPGPTRLGDLQGVDATYSGTITDNRMELRIVLAGKEKDQEAPQYVLERARRGNVRKCR